SGPDDRGRFVYLASDTGGWQARCYDLFSNRDDLLIDLKDEIGSERNDPKVIAIAPRGGRVLISSGRHADGAGERIRCSVRLVDLELKAQRSVGALCI